MSATHATSALDVRDGRIGFSSIPGASEVGLAGAAVDDVWAAWGDV